MTTMLALSDQWLNTNTTATLTNATYTGDNVHTGYYIPNSWWPYDQTHIYHNYWPYYQPITVTAPAKPIRLKFAEVERLRAAAAESKDLKKILAKFTALIEVEIEL